MNSLTAQEPGTLHRVARQGPLVAIIGRPNVGKSTLFNRLAKVRQAITDDQPGVTRDRLYAEVSWDGCQFTLVDTGGYLPEARSSLAEAVTAQVEDIAREADLLVLICDATGAVTDIDRRLADMIRRTGKPWLLVANKLDTPESEARVNPDLHELGLGDPQPVSAATGRRSGDLLEQLVEGLGLVAETPADTNDTAVHAVLAGRPNVGKSTLINRLAGDQVSLVHEQPGTTRDTTSARLAYQGREIVLTDTAGLRRRSRIIDAVEYYSNRRAAYAIEHADVVLVLMDLVEGWTMQDARIIGQSLEAGCGLVVAVNKWDLATAGNADRSSLTRQLHQRFPFLMDYPVIFISALTGKRVSHCLDWILRIDHRRRQRISTARLNEFVADTIRHHPPYGGGREVRVFYATQTGISPPSFVFFASRPDLVDSAYRRFVDKRLREEFDFSGTPLRTAWRSRRGRPRR